MKSAVLLLLTAGVAFASVVGYHIEPVKAIWSGLTPRGGNVSQTVVACWDSLERVELFAGARGNGGVYTAAVIVDGQQVMSSNGTQDWDCRWVRFDSWDYHVAFTKGKTVTIRFTRGGSDSIEFYYRHDDPYPYGEIPNDIVPNFADLCMRVYGRMKAVDSAYWGMVPELPWESDDLRRAWLERARTAGVGFARLEVDWSQVQPGSPTGYSFDWTDKQLRWMQDSAECEVFAVLTRCPKWASSRREWKQLEGSPGSWFWDTVVYCAPRNLWPGTGETNYWATWLDTLVEHCGDRIHTWEIWNEPNDTCTDPTKSFTGWWRRPNMDSAYPGLGGQERGLCSLYVRFCEVAVSVIKGKNGHEADRVLVGSMYRVNWGTEEGVVAGKEWLRGCYDVADSVFWDGVASHPHQDGGPYDSRTFEADADTLRAVMQHYEHNGELWGTEFGVDTIGDSPEDAARSMAQVFIAGKASEANPSRGWDRLCWWLFRKRGQASGHYPLMDSTTDTLYPSYHAFKQMTAALTGKRFNGRVMTGDSAIDNHTRVYEFEDTTTLKKRTWVCWRDEAVSAYTPLPARSDTVDTAALAYNGSPPTDEKDVENSGWLHIAMDPRPAFVTEKTVVSRPDVVVDSVRYVLPPSDTAVLAWVTNRGSRATPHQSPGNQPYPTWAVLYADGDSLTAMAYTDSIPADSSVVFEFARSAIQTPQMALLSVRVNPSQSYVELGTDDNAGHSLKTQ